MLGANMACTITRSLDVFLKKNHLENVCLALARSRLSQTALLKERPVWSKISLVWTLRLADLEGDQASQTLVVSLVFDSWTGEVSRRSIGVGGAHNAPGFTVGGNGYVLRMMLDDLLVVRLM